MGALENKTESYLISEVEKIGGVTYKWVSPGRVGVPDRIVIIDGLIIFVEVKPIGGVLQPWQSREIKRLTDNGACAVVVYGNNDVDKLIIFINDLLQRMNVSKETIKH